MKVLGLTGPTGSGKSTVSAVAKEKGAVVIDCDKTARSVTKRGSMVLGELAAAFGEDILSKNGVLLRKRLAKKAFSTKENTDKLNKIILPYIVSALKAEIKYYREKGAGMLILDAPTLYESGIDKICDNIIVVLSDQNKRRQRIIERDGLTDEQADIRLLASKPDSYYCDRAKHIIYNNGDLTEAKNAVGKLLDIL